MEDNILKLESLIAQNEADIRTLLKRYRIKESPSVMAIKTGFDNYGAEFIRGFLQIVKPESYYTPLPEIGPPLPDGSFVQNTGENDKGGFWKFLDNLFGAAEQGIDLYGKAKQNASNNSLQYQNQQNYQNQNKNNTTLIIAAGLVVFIFIIILIFKK